MKKIIIYSVCILALLNSVKTGAKNDSAAAVECGHAISSIMLSLNSLSQTDFCKYKSILNKEISLQDKKQQIVSNESLNQVHNEIS